MRGRRVYDLEGCGDRGRVPEHSLRPTVFLLGNADRLAHRRGIDVVTGHDVMDPHGYHDLRGALRLVCFHATS